MGPTSQMMDIDWDITKEEFGKHIAGQYSIERAQKNYPEEDFWGIGGGGPEVPNIIPQEIAEETSLQKLIRYWMNERHAPDILPAQEMLLGRLLDHIRKQVRFLPMPRGTACSEDDMLTVCSLCSLMTSNFYERTLTRLRTSILGLC